MDIKPDIAPKILIVDDSPVNLLVLKDHLDVAGFEVVSAENGESCCELALSEHPDLILLDIMMPGMDGFDTLNKLKADEKTSQIPVIYMSSLSQTEHKVKGFECGAVDYITKPFQQEEVIARVATHLTIQKQEKQLRELIVTKDKLFSIIAHDLRSPFNSLIGYSDLLLQQFEKMDEKRILRAIERINVSSKEAFAMLENLLTWARSQMGTLTWTLKEIRLHSLVNSVMSLLKVSAQKKELEIRNEIDSDLTINASHEMLSTIFRNLLSNAIKYTQPGGLVIVRAEDSDDAIEITVSDTGVGISEELIKRLFRIDSVFSTVGTANEKGTGLGLVLCKEFIDNHNGAISVKSEEGKGTEFTIRLPQSFPPESESSTT